MDSSLQLMDERLSSAKYNDMLSVGQEQLVSLRNEPIEEMKPKAFVPESLKTKKETSDRKSRVPSELAATLAIEEKKKTSDVPDIFSTGAICAMGYIATYKGPKEETNDEEPAQPKLERNPGPNFAYANSTGISPFEYSAPYASVNSNMNAGPALNTVSTIATNVLDTDVGLLNPNLFEDVPVLSKEDRIVAATVAMEEYMNKDDGGDAWLDSMKDMMGED